MRLFFVGFFITILAIVAFNIYKSIPTGDKAIQVAQKKLSTNFNFVPAQHDHKLESLAFQAYSKTKEAVTLTPMQLASGKPVLLHFWETWCNFCTNEMPDFFNFYQKHKDSFHVIPISNDRGMGQNVMNFLESKNLKGLPFYHDVGGTLARSFKITSFPTTVIVSRSGKEIGRIIGAFEWKKEGERSLLNLIDGVR